MRLYKKEKVYPNIGEVKYKVFFAWFPVTIGNETRWLERVSVKSVYYKIRVVGFVCVYNDYKWIIKSFEQQPFPDFKLKSMPPESN